MVKEEKFILKNLTGQEVEKIALALANLPYKDVSRIMFKIDNQMIEQTQNKV